MAYIYCITNIINGKKYIGKTADTVENRFKQHVRDSKKVRSEKRPLYSAMNKYGVENFAVETLCETNDPSQDERLYIDQYDTFKSGYNATTGGDGVEYKMHLAEDVLKLFLGNATNKHIADSLGMDVKTVRKIIRVNGFDDLHQRPLGRGLERPVVMICKESGKELMWFDSTAEAHDYTRREGSTSNGHIDKVCVGKRKSANGFFWRYIN